MFEEAELLEARQAQLKASQGQDDDDDEDYEEDGEEEGEIDL